MNYKGQPASVLKVRLSKSCLIQGENATQAWGPLWSSRQQTRNNDWVADYRAPALGASDTTIVAVICFPRTLHKPQYSPPFVLPLCLPHLDKRQQKVTLPSSPASPSEQPAAAHRAGQERDSPLFVLKDELPQLEVTQHQPPVMAVSHRRGDLVEQSGCLLLPQLLAGSDKGVHVPIASLEEHVGFGLPQDDFGDLVDVAVSGQAEARGQGLLIAADVEHLGQG